MGTFSPHIPGHFLHIAPQAFLSEFGGREVLGYVCFQVGYSNDNEMESI